MERVPFEVGKLEELAVSADRFNTKQLAADVGRTMDPNAQAAWYDRNNPHRPIMVPDSTTEIVVRKDASDDVTINGTTFRALRSNRETVLVDVSKLEQSYKQAPEGYQAPGRHNKQALTYGDLLDVNKPARMLRMRDPSDFRQGYKLAALRDRGYKVVPVEVPPGMAGQFKRLAPAPVTKKAVEEEAGRDMVDARAWAEGVIGRGRSIERGMYRDLDEAIEQGAGRGISTRRLGEIIQPIVKTTLRRARFIARDRLGSLNSGIAAQKQQRIGFTFYRWISADDSRVRPEHAALHNVVRSWARPHPTEGHPGDAHGCRCIAVPATEAEWAEQNRGRSRLRAAATAAVAVGVAGLGFGIARRVIRAPQRTPFRPAPARPLEPLRPGAPPRVRPVREVPDPERVLPAAVQRVRQVAEEGAPQVAAAGGSVVPFRRGSARARSQRENRSRFNYAHRLTQAIREAEIAAGQAVSNYAATFGAAVKAIRESRTNQEIRDRLARLVGWGKLVGAPRRQTPRQPRRLTGPSKKETGS